MAIRVESDYRDSVQTVYAKATRESLLSGKSIGILTLAGIGNHRALEDLPSWVPDFSTTATPPPPFEAFPSDGIVKKQMDSTPDSHRRRKVISVPFPRQ